jgi:C1A family cysteine protease
VLRPDTPYSVKWYGWQPDLPDRRDHRYAAPAKTVAALPPSVDLRPGCPPVYNQGDLGSCTSNAIAGAVEFDLMKENQKRIFVPSRLFLYYNERAIEGTVSTDSGAQVRDGIKTVSHQGDCPEALWPYNIKKFAVKPPAKCYSDATKYKAVEYQRVNRALKQFKGCLASGYPFVFGFTVYESFEGAEVAKTGHVNMPKHNEKTLGGHAVMAVGYEDSHSWFLVRNSWGSDWGMKGYFTMPYRYLLDGNLSDDFWTIRVVS